MKSETFRKIGVFEALRKRRMHRNFKSTPVPNELLKKLIYAAKRAPAAGNAPSRVFIVIEDPRILRMIKAVSPGYFGTAPSAIVICSDPHKSLPQAESRRRFLSAFDAGASAENIALAAVELGLGVCFVKAYSEAAIKKILGLPESFEVMIIIVIGYPQEEKVPSPKSRHQAVYLNRYEG